jgi:hypothetical protein
MKKLLAIILTLCLAISVCLTLASCDEVTEPPHEHSFSDDWTKDEAYHWHACTAENCTETSDKAEHAWDDGVEANDVKTYTCTVCGQTKSKQTSGKPMVMTAESWEQMIALLNSDNYTLNLEESMKMAPDEPTAIQVTYNIKFKNENGLKEALYNQSANPTIVDQVYTAETVEPLKQQYLFMVFDILENFENYQRNEADGTYKNAEPISISYPELYGFKQDFVINEAIISVDSEGRLVAIDLAYTQTVHYTDTTGDTFYLNQSWTFYNYGTTHFDAK